MTWLDVRDVTQVVSAMLEPNGVILYDNQPKGTVVAFPTAQVVVLPAVWTPVDTGTPCACHLG